MSESYSRDVDAYIDGVQEFAKPILRRIRGLFHEAFPDIEETIKWSCPHFEYKGIVAQMAGYKNHVRFIFWKGPLLSGFPSSLSPIGDKTQIGALNISSMEDFPDQAELKALILEAIDLNERGVKPPARPKTKKSEIEMPSWFLDAMAENQPAFTTFHTFSPSDKREYLEWVTGAKREATRESRMRQAIEWMAEGKPRNWKYMDKWK